MTKFSLWRDEDEQKQHQNDEEDDDFFVQNPKKRKFLNHQNHPSTSSESHIHVHHHQHQQQKIDNFEKFKNNNNSGETDSTARSNNTGVGPINLILSDPDVLDCSICFEPLTIPVFQCDNGHIACSSCCINLGNKCPSCCGKIGNNRCRAIEKVIESVKVSCCYVNDGCRETLSYCKKHEHEEKCSFAPCLCPFTNCLFRGSPRKLSRHMCREHSDLVVRFHYNSVFSVSMGMDENFLVLQEEKDGALFILSHGNTVAIRCIDSSLSRNGYKYDIALHKDCSSLKFQSSTHCTTGQLSSPPSMDYAMIPGYFYHTNGRLKMEICVWSKDGGSTS